jgi:hypothetical protein
MIAWVGEAYGVLQSQRAAEEEKCRQLLLKAKDHRQIADTKRVKAKLVKQYFDELVNLALQGLCNSKSHHEPLTHYCCAVAWRIVVMMLSCSYV